MQQPASPDPATPRVVSAPHAIAGVLAACRSELEALLLRSAAIQFANLSTIDGRPLLTAGAATAAAATDRIAAMASSLLALSETFAREASHGRCLHTTMSSEGGYIVTVRVPAQRAIYTLSSASDRSENLATALHLTLESARTLGRIFDRVT